MAMIGEKITTFLGILNWPRMMGLGLTWLEKFEGEMGIYKGF